MNIQEYVSIRLSIDRDDRCDKGKIDADSRLRGSIGEDRANGIITVVDSLKMKR